jgi:hypothetical protein
MTSPPLDRLLELLRRQLGAHEVHLVDADAAPSTDAAVLECTLPDGRRLRARLAAPPADRVASEQKMRLLLDSFRDLVPAERRTRPPSPSALLDEELEALVTRAGAVDALVIDAHSPIVWGDADEELSLRPAYETDVIPFRGRPRPAPLEAHGQAEVLPFPVLPRVDPRRREHPLSSRALSEVRARPEIASLHRGATLRHAVREEDFGYVARSFGTIYVLVLVFDAPFDEWTTERALANALPQIEKLVLALPPLDPEPHGKRSAMRKRRG